MPCSSTAPRVRLVTTWTRWFTNHSAAATGRSQSMLPNDQRMVYRHLRRRARKWAHLLGCSLIAAVLVGCSQLPSAPSAPSISARGASSEAMTLYDTNQDGKIDADEMKAPGCPLAAAAKTIDANRDGAVTRDEI